MNGGETTLLADDRTAAEIGDLVINGLMRRGPRCHVFLPHQAFQQAVVEQRRAGPWFMRQSRQEIVLNAVQAHD